MPISGKGAPASHFSPENDRKGRFGGRKWLATGLEGKPRSEVGGPRSENRHPCPSVPTSACRDPWSDWIPTSEVRDRRPERSICVDLREFAVVFGVLVALEDLNWTLARNFVPLCLGVRRLGVLKSRNHLSQRHGVTEGEWGFGPELRVFAALCEVALRSARRGRAAALCGWRKSRPCRRRRGWRFRRRS